NAAMFCGASPNVFPAPATEISHVPTDVPSVSQRPDFPALKPLKRAKFVDIVAPVATQLAVIVNTSRPSPSWSARRVCTALDMRPRVRRATRTGGMDEL